MKITKDFLKFKQFLRNKKLKPVQKVIMEYLFELHNCKFGYAFPSMKDLVMEVNASCNNTVISAIKKLEKMGLLKVNRKNKNNRYYIEDIENFLVGIKKNTSTEKEFSDKKTVCSFNEDNINCEIDEIMLENKIARDMNCSLEEAVNALKYAKERNEASI